MTLRQNIAALVRGELEVDAVKEQLHNDLVNSPAHAAEALQALHEERDKGTLTQQHYDELTQFVSDTIAPLASANSYPPADAATSNNPGNNNTSTDSDPIEEDTSLTRLDTEYMNEDPDNTDTTVGVGMRLRDRFILDEIIGVGGMGTVYRGRDILKIEAQDRNPYVAVKILNDSFKARPDAFIALQREASRQQRLAHPNIATVYDFDRNSGVMYITMEYLDGRTLDQFIQEEVRNTEGLAFERLLPMLEDLCAALSHAHERGIVHADFKPGNCFLTKNNRVKVLDFGIARAVQDPNAAVGDQTLFDPRSIGALTPAYASPEMLTDSEQADARDDIYALACVTYELLSSKHPFHRIPADQAQANNLKPAPIKQLSRRQNAALARALAFERKDRTPTAAQFLAELQAQPGKTLPTTMLVGTAAAILLVAALVLVPRLLADREFEAIVGQLRHADPSVVATGLQAMDQLDATDQARALQVSRSALLSNTRAQFEAQLGLADAQVDYPALADRLATVSNLYPDSATLTELKKEYLLRHDGYLNTLSSQFDSYLQPQHLLPRDDGQDLQSLLERLQYVDPTSPLLTDSRIAGAYAAAAEAALEQDNFAGANSLLQNGLQLAPADLALVDLRDRLQSIEQRLALERQVATAEQRLVSVAGTVNTLAQLNTLLTPIQELNRLAPGNLMIRDIGAELSRKLTPQLDAAMDATSLNDVSQALQNTQIAWTALAQPVLVQRMRERELQLMEEQESLVSQLRLAAVNPNLEAAGQSAQQLLQALITIDANEPRIERAREELVAEIQQRADRLAEAQNFDLARTELAKADPFAGTPGLQSAIQAVAARIDQLQQAEQARVAAAQQAAERDRQQALQLAEAQRQQQLQQAQQRALANATTAIDLALSQFAASTEIPALQQVRSRIADLRRLDPQHPRLVSANADLQQTLLNGATSMSDTQAALDLLADAQQALGPSDSISTLQDQLRTRRAQEMAAEQTRNVNAALSKLSATLADPEALAAAATRRSAAQALGEVQALTTENSTQRQSAESDFVSAYINAAAPLIAAKRFSAATEILSAADTSIPDSQQIATTQAALEEARASYREARVQEERIAKLESLEQRFRREVRSDQLTQAGNTLRNYRALEAANEFATTEATRLMADAYASRSDNLISKNQLTNASKAIAAGKALEPNAARWPQLEQRLYNGRLQLRVLAWFQGNSNRSVATIRQSIAELQQADFDVNAATAAWTKAASERLASLRNNRSAYNRFLVDAQTLLPNAEQLAKLSPIAAAPIIEPVADLPTKPVIVQPPIPDPTADSSDQQPVVPAAPIPLSLAAIAGKWCADSLEIRLSENEMQFKIARQTLGYPISRYVFESDIVRVFWRDKRTGDMVFEFGQFSENSMTQLRGRRENSTQWQNYNRRLRRCP